MFGNKQSKPIKATDGTNRDLNIAVSPGSGEQVPTQLARGRLGHNESKGAPLGGWAPRYRFSGERITTMYKPCIIVRPLGSGPIQPDP